jgi:hypothetical protein
VKALRDVEDAHDGEITWTESLIGPGEHFLFDISYVYFRFSRQLLKSIRKNHVPILKAHKGKILEFGIQRGLVRSQSRSTFLKLPNSVLTTRRLNRIVEKKV